MAIARKQKNVDLIRHLKTHVKSPAASDRRMLV
jgi:hypothetical protein